MNCLLELSPRPAPRTLCGWSRLVSTTGRGAAQSLVGLRDWVRAFIPRLALPINYIIFLLLKLLKTRPLMILSFFNYLQRKTEISTEIKENPT